MVLGIKRMLAAITRRFTGEREVEQSFLALDQATKDLEESKVRLHEALAERFNNDQFADFAKRARTSRL